jgi:hypothetical protein
LAAAKDLTGPVPPECVVYRILNDPQHVKETGEAKSSGFSNSSPQDGETEEDTYMSVFLSDAMAAAGKDVNDLLAWWEKPAKVFWLSAKDLTHRGESVFREPIPEFPGHGGVRRADRGRRSGGQKKELARLAQLVKPAT